MYVREEPFLRGTLARGTLVAKNLVKAAILRYKALIVAWDLRLKVRHVTDLDDWKFGKFWGRDVHVG